MPVRCAVSIGKPVNFSPVCTTSRMAERPVLSTVNCFAIRLAQPPNSTLVQLASFHHLPAPHRAEACPRLRASLSGRISRAARIAKRNDEALMNEPIARDTQQPAYNNGCNLSLLSDLLEGRSGKRDLHYYLFWVVRISRISTGRPDRCFTLRERASTLPIVRKCIASVT